MVNLDLFLMSVTKAKFCLFSITTALQSATHFFLLSTEGCEQLNRPLQTFSQFVAFRWPVQFCLFSSLKAWVWEVTAIKPTGFHQYSVKPQDTWDLENVDWNCGSSVKNCIGCATDLSAHTSVTLGWIVWGYSHFLWNLICGDNGWKQWDRFPI